MYQLLYILFPRCSGHFLCMDLAVYIMLIHIFNLTKRSRRKRQNIQCMSVVGVAYVWSPLCGLLCSVLMCGILFVVVDAVCCRVEWTVVSGRSEHYNETVFQVPALSECTKLGVVSECTMEHCRHFSVMNSDFFFFLRDTHFGIFVLSQCKMSNMQLLCSKRNINSEQKFFGEKKWFGPSRNTRVVFRNVIISVGVFGSCVSVSGSQGGWCMSFPHTRKGVHIVHAGSVCLLLMPSSITPLLHRQALFWGSVEIEKQIL